jgi:MoaA/NifB/PqqE/SkfB family radical SAM enzyme
MLLGLVYRQLRTTDPKCLVKFAWNFGLKGILSIERHKRRLKRGEYFPPYLYISIINSCNLRCQGCWVDVEGPRKLIELPALKRMIADARDHGNSFFGLLGGEPFLHPDLLALGEAFPDCYFQVFTNGHFITPEVAEAMRRLGNMSPLISIEGKELVSDTRRGNREVFHKSLIGLENSTKARLLTGVATSVCASNIDELLSESWLDELIRRGAHYVWYHTYRPVGPRMSLDLALRPDQLLRVRRFVTEMRARKPIGIADAYYDHRGGALCPMVTGMSHHIAPTGDIEPCPIIQFSKDTIHDPRGVFETMRSSAFLRDFRELAGRTTRGCLVLERPDLVKALVLKHGARDSTLRQKAMAELDAMPARFSQWLPGREIPERHWGYRLAKRLWFNDFGTYSQLEADAVSRARELELQLQRAGPATEASCESGLKTHRL